MKKICGIYKIVNKMNNFPYIGSSSNMYERWSEHKRLLRKNQHSRKLQNAWNKYKEDNFQFEIIEECKEEDLEKREQHWIDYFESYKRNKGYNTCEKAYGGPRLFGKKNPMYGKKGKDSPRFGIKRTNDERKRISEKQRGEKGNNHKLNWENIKEIRRLYNEEGLSFMELSNLFKVHVGTIQPIIQNKTWKDDDYTYIRYGNLNRLKMKKNKIKEIN